ncbi:MAG: DNA repair helicase XPB [Blastocatellia bacterium]
MSLNALGNGDGSYLASYPDTHFDPANPLIAQGDRSLLLETHHPAYHEVRAAISPFAELEKSPEHIHTYRLTPLSLWNATAAGLTAADITNTLLRYAKYPVPGNVLTDVRELCGRWGRVRLRRADGALTLESDDGLLLAELRRRREISPYLGARQSDHAIDIAPEHRGALKQALLAVGWPVEDLAGYATGEPLPLDLRRDAFDLRDYQEDAAEAFYYGGTERGGSGVIVMPCGSGKTIVGMAAMARVGQTTLILTTSRTSVQQWRRELLAKTTLEPEQITEYQGETRAMAPVTITTYQMLTWRSDRTGDFPNMRVFEEGNWGLIIYDEVHLLPAPIFRMTAELQARRRLGLTATLVREDGREGDVFSLIGPKKYDAPWRELEQRGWIAEANCLEVRCKLPQAARMDYAVATPREKFRVASENPVKPALVRHLLALHDGAHALVIGQYLEQLQMIAGETGAPLITGKTSQKERERLFAAFRAGEERVLILSKVGNFAIDLPDAEVLIQVSGAYGSRQEEAQRLGRILRPKSDGRQAWFYTLVSRETEEEDYAHHRQLFLTEQGYGYGIVDEEEL